LSGDFIRLEIEVWHHCAQKKYPEWTGLFLLPSLTPSLRDGLFFEATKVEILLPFICENIK